MTRLIAPTDAGARARAAIAFSGKSHGEVSRLTGLSTAMLGRMTSRTNPRDATVERLWAIADACGVPRSFMEDGFATEQAAATAESQMTDLRRQVDELRGMYREVIDRLPGPDER